MEEDMSIFFVCDVWFNEELIVDVNVSKTCCLGKIVQGLCEDKKFRTAVLTFWRAKGEEKADTDTEIETFNDLLSLKSFHSFDRSIFRAYVAVRIIPAWKWLEFKDFVADFENKKESLTVGDVLGPLCSGANKPILRIVPKSKSEADDREVKTIVQELLKTKSLATLSAAGCPLSKGMLSLIGQDKYTYTISFEKREKFVHWLRHQDLTNDVLTWPGTTGECQEQLPLPIKIARSRVAFDPETELSTLLGWFDEDQRPGKQKITEYTEDLNKSRINKKCKRMLTPESIAGWFKNRRAKMKKQEGDLPNPWEKINEQAQTPTSSTSEEKKKTNGEKNGTEGESEIVTVAMAAVESEADVHETRPSSNMEPENKSISGPAVEDNSLKSAKDVSENVLALVSMATI